MSKRKGRGGGRQVFLRSGEGYQIICPNCNEHMDGITGVRFDKQFAGDKAPLKDSFTMCCYCGALLRFTDDRGTVRALSAEDRATYLTGVDPAVIDFVNRMRERVLPELNRGRTPDFTKKNYN